jgi:hypothetical protein
MTPWIRSLTALSVLFLFAVAGGLGCASVCDQGVAKRVVGMSGSSGEEGRVSTVRSGWSLEREEEMAIAELVGRMSLAEKIGQTIDRSPSPAGR